MSACASPYCQSRVKEVLIKHCSVVESAHTHLYAHGTNKLIMQKSKKKRKKPGVFPYRLRELSVISLFMYLDVITVFCRILCVFGLSEDVVNPHDIQRNLHGGRLDVAK